MKKYEIEVSELCTAHYVIEANSKEEAIELFDNWVDSHQELVNDDLMDNSHGWEYSIPEETNKLPDILYDELKG